MNHTRPRVGWVLGVILAGAAMASLWFAGTVTTRGPAAAAQEMLRATTIDVPVSASLDDTAIKLDTVPANLNTEPLQRFGRSAVPYVDAWRFQAVAIPQGATIVSATLRLVPAGWQTGVPIAVLVRGEATDNAANFANTQPLAHLRPHTMANVVWTLTYTPTAPFLSPDLAPVLQEIVNRPGWNSGQALTLMAISNSGARAYLDLFSYDFQPNKAARLSVSFLPGGGTQTPTPQVTTTPSPTSTATATPGLNLGQALPLECWQRVSGSNTGFLSQIDHYGCRPDWLESGPERVYSLGLLAGEPLIAELTNVSPAADLDLFLLTGALPDTCQAYGDSSLSYTAGSTGVVYLVVDGYDGSVGSFDLLARCPARPTPSPTPLSSVTPLPAVRTHLPFVSR